MSPRLAHGHGVKCAIVTIRDPKQIRCVHHR